MNYEYDPDSFTRNCRNCGVEDQFKRERSFEQRQYLALDDDGYMDIETDDMEGPDGEWLYSCTHCGNSSVDLEDLLAYRENEEDHYCGGCESNCGFC